ncbi:TPR-like protein [Rhodotorula sp. JG-1b]|nr:TPR-like protein [Rhodotorula sp. JG-1b]
MSAFSAMMGGAECSTSSNPLSQFIKAGHQDHSLHQSGPLAPHQQQQSMRSHTPQQQQQHNDEAQRFFEQPPTAAGGPLGGGGLDQLRSEIDAMARVAMKQPNGAAPGLEQQREWASQYRPAGANLLPADMARMQDQFRLPQGAEGRPSDFAQEFHQQHLAATSSSASASAAGPSMYGQARPGFAPSYGAFGSAGGGMGMGMHSYASPMHSNYATPPPPPQQQQVDVKGKGRFVELDDADWEAQFAQSDAQLLKDLESTWAAMRNQLDSNTATSDAELAQWESQFGSQFNDLHGSPLLDGDDADDLFDEMPQRMRRAQWNKDNVDQFLQDQTPFPYQEENDYLDHADPYAEGMRLLQEGAPLSEAALAFEAACRKDESRAEAWKAAGETWAADEREAKGIRALEKAVACGGPAGVAAWLSLAVAYVNEGQELRALATLEKWLSIAYPSISLPALDSTQIRSPWDASNRVIDLFLAAAQAGPTSRAPGQSSELGIVDPDVQVGLGILFYSNSEYEKAKDCFEAALSMRPDDFLLWNRLGATLANSGHPEDAIQAYRKALDLRPTFTRAIYNLGVSCLNIGCYHEAAEHLLAALQGQMTREEMVQNRKGKGGDADLGRANLGDGSDNLWHTLRRAFLCMDRHDLADKAMPGASLDEFRQEFDF